MHTTLAGAALVLLSLTQVCFASFASLRERKALRKKMGLDEDEEAAVEDPGGWLCCFAVVKGSCWVASGGANGWQVFLCDGLLVRQMHTRCVCGCTHMCCAVTNPTPLPQCLAGAATASSAPRTLRCML